MQELTTFDDVTPDLTNDEKTLLRKAGASEHLIKMCDTDVSDLPVSRHSVLMESKKYLRGTSAIGPQLTEDNANDFSAYGGHFFMAVWEGDLYRAYSRADKNNTKIMAKAFDARLINARRPSNAKRVEV